MYAHKHTYMHTCIHAYIHTYIHSYIHIRRGGGPAAAGDQGEPQVASDK